MGNTYEVWAWVKNSLSNIARGNPEYIYEIRYSGEDFDEAMSKMAELKDQGVGCVKFYWR